MTLTGDSEWEILDLYCGAGGAAMGLHRAFPRARIVGVDIVKQPRYPFEFIQGDALTFSYDGYNFIWASPPCQRYSNGAKQNRTTHKHPDLIARTRERLQETDAYWTIENIYTARQELRSPIMLCGEMFGLGVFRHRLFESNFYPMPPPHQPHHGKIGDGKMNIVTGHPGGSSKRDNFKNGGTTEWRLAMGIDWMTGKELAEAIPPAYSEWIGRALYEIAYRRQLPDAQDVRE